MRRLSILALVLAAFAVSANHAGAQRQPACAADNAGLKLPDGFCAMVFADSVPRARHIVVAPNGDVFVATRNSRDQRDGGILSLRDTTGDGKADMRVRFGQNGGTGIALRGAHLWFGTDDAILRYRLPVGNLLASTQVDTIVRDLPVGGHRAKSITLGRGSDLFVNIGSRTNACQVADRQAASPGHDPCTELETRAGVWRFDANRKNQRQTAKARFASGLRNVVALHFADGQLYGAQHGRDNLASNWGEHFDERENAEKPAEILVRIDRGSNYGWPYCYYDQDLKSHVLAPEYGGNGSTVGDRCDDIQQPLVAFPGHWAPNGLVKYTGQQFPERYRGGFFVAFHGSWNRAPLPQAGYNVAFVPMTNGSPGQYEIFADGFAGAAEIQQPSAATHRPTGLAVAPDGSLYITDDAGGRIYRVFYRGN
ncbi:MAG TPA: PQQ-dependent sugar dehydrogenase [Thiobacillus sp.]|nr:PQQ-dependent sugar dehydrogenase [Thiobacillus sp.]